MNDAAVIGAHPMYSRVESKMGSENRVSGTTLIIRPTRSVSPDELTRALQCHSARALLGQGDPAKLLSDPYWVPDSWLEISVAKEDETNYAVSLRADTIAKNIELYSRATSYAESHGSKLQ